MPAAAGARALLSAKFKSPRRLPRVAVHAPVVRCFHASSPVRTRSDDPPNPDEPPPPDSKKDNGSAETPSQAAAAEAKKDKLRKQGYGSARARATRSRADELPAVLLPSWFINDNVSLYESRPIGSPSTLLCPLGEADRDKVLALMDFHIDNAALTEADVEMWKDKVLHAGPGQGAEGLKKLLSRGRALHNTALLKALALVHHPDANPDHIERLRRHHSDTGVMRLSWWSNEDLSGDAQRWLSNIRSDSVPGSGALHGSPLANRPDPEYPVCVELLAAVRSELLAPGPVDTRQESRRPVVVLTVLNRKGPSVAESVINDIATDLKADVVHLDAYSIANLVGKHLGENPYSARRSLSVLGYSAAEMNGRLAPRPDADSEHEIGMVAVALPPRLRSYLSTRDTSSTTNSDGRWEEMKIGAALDAIIAAADIKRGVAQADTRVPQENLIIHVHDYVELNSLHRTVIDKLRTIADRMWMAGRKVVLVGSSSGDVNRSSQWRDQVIDIGREGAHVIPFHASETSEWMENYDNFHDNLNNIEDMLQAMLGNHADITFRQKIRVEDGRILVNSMYDYLVDTLSSHLYDVQWVYRLASVMVGSRTPQHRTYGLSQLQYALEFMSDRNKHWSSLCPSVRPPYFSPLFTSRGSSSSMSSFLSSSPDEWSMPSSTPGNLRGSAASKEYDQHEQKLLSGLINAKDIHTTFNDIIVPQETKESLIGLTSLSLIRPEAFSYGVLKTERIPGCLLYGPPGTGKTLLAKAVAKESGANMLEVSAASINDMWLGQSEKNVRALFSLARKLAPAVIFLDEADALLGARHNAPGRTAHRETITQFLREWDGLSDVGRGAFIMVATNRPFDLDEAVLRRLPRKILVDLPLRPEREAILRVVLRDERLAPDVDLPALAAHTELYSGSDLKNLCVSAAMEAVREEVRAREAWAAARGGGGGGDGDNNEEPFQFPERRVLHRRHFDKGLRDISASISEDMDSLKAIRKFDEQYGDAGRKKRGRRSIGFEVVPGRVATEEARVRQVGAG